MIGYGKNFDKIVREERKLKELNEKLRLKKIFPKKGESMNLENDS